MKKATLTFHITPANYKDLSFDETDRYSQEFIRSLGLKVHSGCWSDIELDMPVIHEFIKEAKRRIEIGEAIFYGYNSLSQKLIESSRASSEWFLLNPSKSLDMSIDDNIISCKAYKIPNNINITHGFSCNPFVPEKFVEICSKNNLTGIEFLWCVDTGKYRARQWYIPIAKNPLGKGIDHPWFDQNSLLGSLSWQPINPTFRTGVWHFKVSQIKEGIVFDDEIYKDIYDLFLPFDLTINSCRRYLRDYLPSTDFAYIWDSEDKNEKYAFRERKLCMNRNAKECLIDSKIITEQDFEPILIYDKLPSTSILLDGLSELPCPFYTEDELDELKIQIEKKWSKHIQTEKPAQMVSIKQALRMFRQAKKERPEDFEKGVQKNNMDNSELVLPDYWIDILKVADGCVLDSDCELLPYNIINRFNGEKQKYIQSIQEDYPYHYIAVGCGADGDWFALDKHEPFGKDCKVFRISHEDLSIIDSWDNIPFFISEIISGYYD